MEQQIIATFSPLAISTIFVAIFMAGSRLAPFTKPYWTFFPKAVQAGLPSLVAGLPLAINAFATVKTWLDFAQALLIVGAIPAALAAPGLSSPHDEQPPPPPAGPSEPGGGNPKPRSVPPLTAAGLLLCCLTLSGCGLFESPEPMFAHAAVYIADAGNAVSAAEAILPSLKLSSDDEAYVRKLIARARAALSAAAAATNGAEDLTSEQLDTSLAAFRVAWADIESAFSGQKLATDSDPPALQAPLCARPAEKAAPSSAR